MNDLDLCLEIRDRLRVKVMSTIASHSPLNRPISETVSFRNDIQHIGLATNL